MTAPTGGGGGEQRVEQRFLNRVQDGGDGPMVASLAGYLVSFAALAQAVKDTPVGVAYALWSALGTAAIVAIGAAFLDEPITVVKVVGVSLIVAGVVTLNVGGATTH